MGQWETVACEMAVEGNVINPTLQLEFHFYILLGPSHQIPVERPFNWA